MGSNVYISPVYCLDSMICLINNQICPDMIVKGGLISEVFFTKVLSSKEKSQITVINFPTLDKFRLKSDLAQIFFGVKMPSEIKPL